MPGEDIKLESQRQGEPQEASIKGVTKIVAGSQLPQTETIPISTMQSLKSYMVHN